jgi:hypothetical protein
MVMSLPVSAFQGIDDDGDGLLSLAEGNKHRAAIEAQVRSGVQLVDAQGALPLEGVMMNLSPPENAPSAPAADLVVIGRYALGTDPKGLSLKLSLFGTQPDQRRQEVTVTRGNEKQRMVLAPGREQRALLSGAWAVFVDYILLGSEHVLRGMDHLLFLLVVLATGWGLRQVALALTCFTAGHAITLFGSVWGGWAVPASVVEPAIAATIVGMVLFDQWSARSTIPLAASSRLSLIFACALVHGLGLAGALVESGQDTGHLLWSLAGFNVGIELSQIAVASLMALVMWVVQRVQGASVKEFVTRLASIAAFAAGSVWMAERLVITT